MNQRISPPFSAGDQMLTPDRSSQPESTPVLEGCQLRVRLRAEANRMNADHSAKIAVPNRDASAAQRSGSPGNRCRSRTAEAIRRCIDLGWSVPLAILMVPAWLLVAASCGLGRNPIRWSECFGKNAVRFRRYQIDGSQLIGGSFLLRTRMDGLLGPLANVLKGDLTLVGPRPLSVAESRPDAASFRARCSVTPGLICLWSIRRRTNMACQSEWVTDQEYLLQRGLIRDLGIVSRGFVATLYGRSRALGEKGYLIGIPFDNVSMTEAIERICDAAQRPGLTRVAFINADCVNLASKHPAYRDALQTADYVFADGIGIKIAGQLVGCPVKENVNGTDLFPLLCRAIEGTGSRLFLLGGRPGVAERVREWIETHAAGVTVCGLQHGYFPASEQANVVRNINRSRADIVLVAFGAPKQELWIQETLTRSRARVAIGVGGLFDFYSGRIPRAPLWLREMGLEWTYRLYQEPRRLWRRYIIGNTTFLGRVILHRFRHGCERTLVSTTPQFEVE
jgi:N-acetylglucosaminyldiphosphoundecaprenol N-acetyl-beta-D-mannosaminyltransferase